MEDNAKLWSQRLDLERYEMLGGGGDGEKSQKSGLGVRVARAATFLGKNN